MREGGRSPKAQARRRAGTGGSQESPGCVGHLLQETGGTDTETNGGSRQAVQHRGGVMTSVAARHVLTVNAPRRM